jgi:hypothetical protein
MRFGSSSIARGLEQFWKSQDVNDIKELLNINHANSSSFQSEANREHNFEVAEDHGNILVPQIRDVWILAKPLSHALKIRPFAYSSKGKYHLSHWGVFVSQLPVNELMPILDSDSELPSSNPGSTLGFLIELHQDENGMITINTTNPFLHKHLQDWPMVSASVVGETTKSNKEIETQGLLSKFRG